MAASSQPIRSISLPARSHPTSLKIEQTLNRLKSRPVYSSDQVQGAESIQLGLLNLVELYAEVQDLILSFSTQNKNLIEEAIESSVSLIDTCSSGRDLISGFREQVCDLQSALRRKGYSSIDQEKSMYLSFRKKAAKEVGRCLKVLKQGEGKFGISAPMIDSDVSLVRLVRETYNATIVVFRSLFLFLSTPSTSKWSMVSRLVVKGTNKNRNLSEVSEVDFALKNDTKSEVMTVQGRIGSLDSSLQILEGELGCLFRCLLQNRVSLLNILTN
ncbi:Elongation factor G [Bienertia sinuspersici]